MSFLGCGVCGASSSALCLCRSSGEHPQPGVHPSTPTSNWSFPSQSFHYPSTPTAPSPSSVAPLPASYSPSPSESGGPATVFYSYPDPLHGQPGNAYYGHPTQCSAPPLSSHPYAPPPTSSPPTAIDPALFHDSTTFVVNSNGKRSLVSQATRARSKRARGVSGPGASSRGVSSRGRGRGGQTPSIPSSSTAAAAAAVAPVDPMSSSGHRQPAPLPYFGSLVRKNRSTGAGTTSTQSPATDVWFHLYGLPPGSRDEPSERPDNQPRMYDKPPGQKYEYVTCRLCRDKWHTWKCQNGQTGTIRDHFRSCHFAEWRESVVRNQLKGWESLGFKPSPTGDPAFDDSTFDSELDEPLEPFTVEGLGRRIARWIAADDQAINVVENDLFREVIRYASTSPYALKDKDIPHRTHTHETIVNEYERELEKLRQALKTSLGRVSFTSDMWTCKILRGYMAITVHFCVKNAANQLELRSRLGAFRYIPGHHTGANMAEQFVTVLEELGILDKIGCITLDNASNCNTMMAELEQILTAKGIKFSKDGNRLRCFPHVVNIAVKHGLKALTTTVSTSDSTSSLGHASATVSVPSTIPDSGAEEEEAVLLRNLGSTDSTYVTDPALNEALQADEEYANALASDPIKCARQLVAACRASSVRREAFSAAIEEANRSLAPEKKIPSNTQLLRDVDTRWSSVLMMVDRVLEAYPGIKVFMSKDEQKDIAHLLLTEHQLDVLCEIRQFLLIPHHVQQILSAYQAPTAPLVLPAYEDFLDLLNLARTKYPRIAHAISASMAILESYVNFARQTRVYALAMLINPEVKLQWVQTHWPPESHLDVKTWLIEAVFEHRKSERRRRASSSQPASSTPDATNPRPVYTDTIIHTRLESRATQAQRSGFSSLRDLRRELSTSSTASSASTSADPEQRQSDVSLESDEAREDRLDAEDMEAATAEVNKYFDEPVIQPEENLTMLAYWESREHKFPFLYHVAIPLLSSQASGVTSERVFSSSKETDTLRRTSLSAATMEVLQVLKYSINEERREKQSRRGFVRCNTELDGAAGAAPGVRPGSLATPADSSSEVPEAEEGGVFTPVRMSDIVQVMREAGSSVAHG